MSSNLDKILEEKTKLQNKLSAEKEKVARIEQRIQVLKNRNLLIMNQAKNKESRQFRRERVRRMCTLAGDIEKIYREVYDEKIFEDEETFEKKREKILHLLRHTLPQLFEIEQKRQQQKKQV